MKTLILRALLALPLSALPAAAQTSTHLNVPAKQIVYITFYKSSGDGYGQMSGISISRADGSYVAGAVPSGQALVIRELSISTNYGTSTNPFLVSLLLTGVDATNTYYYGGIRDTFTVSAGVYSSSYHFKADVGLVVAGSLKPKVSLAPNNGPFAVSTWDSISVQGWGYLTSF